MRSPGDLKRSHPFVKGSDSNGLSKQPEVEAYEYIPTDGGESRSPDLAAYGYSSVNVHNSLGILQKLENLEVGGARKPSPRKQRKISLCQPALDIYSAVLRQLPCPSCVRDLVAIFFDEVNWQYTILDRNYFIPRLEQYYQQHPLQPASPRADTTVSSEKLIFSALVFQVLVYALQFIPARRSENLHPPCLKGIAEDGNGLSEDATMRLLSLLPKDVINLDYIAAQILRTAWLKNRGLIAEAWLVLAQAAINAQEIGLHRDDGKLYADDAESAIEELWEVVLRRRLMLNLYLWDSQMGMVLGKPLNFKSDGYTIIPPTDCEIPRNRTSTAPFQRTEYDKPNTFTVRLLEYHIHKYLPQVRELEAQGPYPRDYGKVVRLHQIALDYIASIPPIYRFENPDRSYDAECPQLASQREFLCATVWLFVLMLHRPYIFSLAKSRTEILKAGIEMLNAQQRFFLTLEQHHYRMFTLAYLTVEPCVSMLAVLIAFPSENVDLVTEAFRCIKESLSRVNKIRRANRVAGQGADVIHNLVLRAEKNRPSPSLGSKPSNSSSEGRSSEVLMTPSSHGAGPFYPMADQPPLFANNPVFAEMPAWNTHFQQTSSSVPLPVNSEYTFDDTPFRPVADLTYNDVALAMSEEGFSAESGSERLSNEMPQQFRGEFGEGSFWNFVNRASGV
ncbi:hypothetical protein A1O7_06094 [Cladophialophora yegresii CBS 114405]|uniref:Xylanolytic transcriptional activator regulatory domain-containing protein n=1 Tax=Cladophialophora yegresii CBS 114405 TaxID=1182544 RepID=W9W2C6_9EURO|nr:uncharacterized protein A1O7_06094 [Cladophialophora yegresii CBS 114405]EXJ58666.1 hypothetical protein A1O7_06094 [Cladophialophora yegresii CBS 114405]